ncbi:MAG TPA: hypothetical protein VG389_22595, partial [Myxococcota bacterium]|nr:hypothetical protein [Myxococcota bacterium]
PAALYNVAQAFRNLGDCEQADWFYKAFLRESRPEDPARSKAEEAIAACDALIASGGLRRVTVPPLPADELRAIAPETAAAETGVDEAAGADGEEIDGPIDGGHSVYAKTHRGRTRAFFVAGAAGLGVAAAGSGVAIAASGAVLRNVREAEAATGSAAYDVAFGRARNAAHLANAFWGVAAASAAAGATFTILWLASGSRGRGFAFAPVVGPRSAGLLFAARF